MTCRQIGLHRAAHSAGSAGRPGVVPISCLSPRAHFLPASRAVIQDHVPIRMAKGKAPGNGLRSFSEGVLNVIPN